jgi:hypothetical protein
MGHKDMIESREGAAAELPAVRFRAIAVGGVALRAVATGALAVGAAAIGALAVGAVAVGRLRVGNASAQKLTVGRLEVDELVIGGRSVSAEDIGPVPGSRRQPQSASVGIAPADRVALVGRTTGPMTTSRMRRLGGILVRADDSRVESVASETAATPLAHGDPSGALLQVQ